MSWEDTAGGQLAAPGDGQLLHVMVPRKLTSILCQRQGRRSNVYCLLIILYKTSYRTRHSVNHKAQARQTDRQDKRKDPSNPLEIF